MASQGKEINDAMAMAIDCLAAYIQDDIESGVKTPAPSNINDIDPVKIFKEIDSNVNSSKCFVSYVSVDVEEYAKLHFNKAVKKL